MGEARTGHSTAAGPRFSRDPGSESRARKASRPRVSTGDIFELFPYGILVLTEDGVVTRVNQAVSELLAGGVEDFEERDVTCCELFGCRRPGSPFAHGCLTELAIAAAGPLPEIRVDLPDCDEERAVWVTAARLRSDARSVLVHVRPGDARDRRRRTIPHWIAERRLEVRVLGRTQVRSGESDLGGNWLAQRPGKLLKYLLSERHRVVYAEEIAEALWPGGEQAVVGNVRHFVHMLRAQIEPERPKRAPAMFVVSEAGGYRLNLQHVDVDAERFERDVGAGRAAFERRDLAAAKCLLEGAMSLYAGDFIADEPYALWALGERERLRALAGEALDALAEIAWLDHDYDAATAHLERLADMHPFDSDIARRLIGLALYRGRHTMARRRYASFKMRVLHEFGEPPDFELADVLRETQRGGSPPPVVRR